MRASDLLGAPVRGPGGQDLGRVVDVRLVQDGPLIGGFAALRIDGLVIGRRGLAGRLGYDRTEVRGPAALSMVVRWWTRGNRYLPWAAVRSHEQTVVADSAELAPVPRL